MHDVIDSGGGAAVALAPTLALPLSDPNAPIQRSLCNVDRAPLDAIVEMSQRFGTQSDIGQKTSTMKVMTGMRIRQLSLQDVSRAQKQGLLAPSCFRT